MKAIDDIKEVYRAFLISQSGNGFERRYKAAKKTLNLTWVLKIRPALDKILTEEENGI